MTKLNFATVAKKPCTKKKKKGMPKSHLFSRQVTATSQLIGRVRLVATLIASIKDNGFSKSTVATMEALTPSLTQAVAFPALEEMSNIPVMAEDPRSEIVEANMNELSPAMIADVKAQLTVLIDGLEKDLTERSIDVEGLKEIKAIMMEKGFTGFKTELNTTVQPMFDAPAFLEMLNVLETALTVSSNVEALGEMFAAFPTTEELQAALDDLADTFINVLGVVQIETGEYLLDPSAIDAKYKQSEKTLEEAGWTAEATLSILDKCIALGEAFNKLSADAGSLKTSLTAVMASIANLETQNVQGKVMVKQSGEDGLVNAFDWEDGNPENEDRSGKDVVLVEGKVRVAAEGEEVFGTVIGPVTQAIGDDAQLMTNVLGCYQFLVNWFVLVSGAFDELTYSLDHCENIFTDQMIEDVPAAEPMVTEADATGEAAE